MHQLVEAIRQAGVAATEARDAYHDGTLPEHVWQLRCTLYRSLCARFAERHGFDPGQLLSDVVTPLQ